MPRPDWFDDDTMSRERSHHRYDDDRDFTRVERGYGDYQDRDRGALFVRDRHLDERGRSRPIGGWGDLMGDEDRYRERDRDRDRDRWRERGDRSGWRGEDRHFGPDDHSRDIPMDETERLIASNKVEGTPVYDRNGDRLGTVHNFMVDKYRGQVVYAVLRHGTGFLGLGDRYYPLEWDQLTFDTRLGGYHVQLTEEDLKGRGSFDHEGRWHNRARREHSGRERFERDRDQDRGYQGRREAW